MQNHISYGSLPKSLNFLKHISKEKSQSLLIQLNGVESSILMHVNSVIENLLDSGSTSVASLLLSSNQSFAEHKTQAQVRDVWNDDRLGEPIFKSTDKVLESLIKLCLSVYKGLAYFDAYQSLDDECEGKVDANQLTSELSHLLYYHFDQCLSQSDKMQTAVATLMEDGYLVELQNTVNQLILPITENASNDYVGQPLDEQLDAMDSDQKMTVMSVYNLYQIHLSTLREALHNSYIQYLESNKSISFKHSQAGIEKRQSYSPALLAYFKMQVDKLQTVSQDYEKLSNLIKPKVNNRKIVKRHQKNLHTPTTLQLPHLQVGVLSMPSIDLSPPTMKKHHRKPSQDVGKSLIYSALYYFRFKCKHTRRSSDYTPNKLVVNYVDMLGSIDASGAINDISEEMKSDASHSDSYHFMVGSSSNSSHSTFLRTSYFKKFVIPVIFLGFLLILVDLFVLIGGLIKGWSWPAVAAFLNVTGGRADAFFITTILIMLILSFLIMFSFCLDEKVQKEEGEGFLRRFNPSKSMMLHSECQSIGVAYDLRYPLISRCGDDMSVSKQAADIAAHSLEELSFTDQLRHISNHATYNSSCYESDFSYMNNHSGGDGLFIHQGSNDSNTPNHLPLSVLYSGGSASHLDEAKVDNNERPHIIEEDSSGGNKVIF